ncbi:MAG: CRISPR-associated protein Cas4 [Bernardetiaceae bacterium]
MFTITPSHIIQYLFCPRFTFFEYVLGIPQYEDKHHKVMLGRRMHDQRLEQNKGYLRRRVGATDKHLDQYLTNDWLRGIVDEVLELEDGTMAPLDYKFAKHEEDRVFRTHRVQLTCYALLIQENFQKVVNRGFLVYIRSNHKLVTLPIEEKDFEEVRRAAEAVFKIIDGEFYPRATRNKKQCLNCTYRNICTQ